MYNRSVAEQQIEKWKNEIRQTNGVITHRERTRAIMHRHRVLLDSHTHWDYLFFLQARLIDKISLFLLEFLDEPISCDRWDFL